MGLNETEGKFGLDKTMFKFSFSSFKTKSKNLKYVVYAKNDHDMKMFLKQHNFSTENIHVECFPTTEFDGDEDSIIKPHKFKSNSSDEIFNIYTTTRFVEWALEGVCQELSDSLLLGDPITRMDIGIIKIIIELITKLQHVLILDFTLMNVDETEFIHPETEEYIQSLYLDKVDYHPFAHLDDSFIYDSIMSDYCADFVAPITLEGYVYYFTEMITDVYE